MALRTTGRFAWHELHTNQRARAIKFYGELAGWQIKDVAMGPGDPYGLCLLDGKDLGGIVQSTEPGHSPPHWLAYIAVDEVDASAVKATSLGGKVIQAPMDIPDVGRFAVIADPQGATFALYKHLRTEEERAVPPYPIGSFCWDELMTSDPEAAVAFYSALFGYEHEMRDMGPMGPYHMLRRGEGRSGGAGGILKMPPMVRHPYWLPYIYVQDVDASTEKAKELGAHVYAPPESVHGAGRFSIIGDPTGAAVGFYRDALAK
jgi:hypothetical protein